MANEQRNQVSGVKVVGALARHKRQRSLTTKRSLIPKSEAGKIGMLILTILPIGSYLALLIFVLMNWAGPGLDFNLDSNGVLVLVIINVIASLVYPCLLLWYILIIVNNSSLTIAAQVAWVVAVVYASIVSMPTYWYLHIWLDSPVQPPVAEQPA